MNMKSSITLPYGMQSSDRALRLTTGITNVKSIKRFHNRKSVTSKKSN